jgi:polar amino acid transport system substrate-binding protein
MLQVIQYQKTGEMSVEELPVPKLRDGGVLVQNVFSLISSGTERTSVETAQASLIGKARSRPDLVKQVIDNVKREGLLATYEKVQTRLDNYKELGYSSAGMVVESSVTAFKPGDAVACAGYAHHAEFIFVPKNLVVKIPPGVSFEEAAFTTLGAIALQGVRQADVRLGEQVAVIGLGLVGLITVQLLKANGCRVIGLDISEDNFELAKKLGCDACTLSTTDAEKVVEAFTKGYGTDAVIITAATRSNEPLELALQFARKKSKVVVVGAVGMKVPRTPFYEKELELRISCAYGPGRYDPEYEEKGKDYPIGYVRWTENRNMEAVLDLISQKKLDVKSLISHKFPIQDALRAYDIITGKVKEKHLGILIEYPNGEKTKKWEIKKVQFFQKAKPNSNPSQLVAGFIGAGNFAQSYLIPPLQQLGIRLKGVATTKPVNARSVGKKFRFEYGTTEADEILNDPEINTVFIATRHDSHAHYVIEALKKGKHVFVEKPLAIHETQLKEIKDIYETQSSLQGLHLMVGFNRRFSRPFKDIKDFFKETPEPFVITYRIHAGFIPKTSWIQDPSQGGRIIGEGCHFIDGMMFLIETNPIRIYAESIDSRNSQVENHDNINVTLKFSDGSVGNLLYLANGDNSVEKEYCEVYSSGKTVIMDNFKKVSFYHKGKKKTVKYDGTKGHKQEIEHFVKVILGEQEPQFSFGSIYYTTLTTFKIVESLQRGIPCEI